MDSFTLTPGQLSFIETFGFLQLPGLLSDRLAAIDRSFEELMQSHGGREHDGSQRLEVVPGINHHAYLCSLLDDERIDGIARSLLGPDYQYWNSDANYYVGDTPWHSDWLWPPPFRFYKIAIYLDPLTRDTGALRVIPGSHRWGEPYAETIQRELMSGTAWGGVHGSQVPAVAVETQPGDVAIFNYATKHSAWGGSQRRRMFTLNFFPKCATDQDTAVFEEIVRSHGYTAQRVFGSTDGPLLKDAPPERLRHLQELRNHFHEFTGAAKG